MVIYDHRVFEIENYDFYSLIFVKFYLSFLRIKNPCLLCFYFHPVNKSAIFFLLEEGEQRQLSQLSTVTLSSLRSSLRLSGTFTQAKTVDNTELDLSKGIRIQV